MAYDRKIVTLITRIALESDLVPYELLGGLIAESGLDPNAVRPVYPRDASTGETEDELYARYWPDVSAGLGQQTAAYAAEHNIIGRDANGVPLYPGLAEIKRVFSFYLDPEHAAKVAAKQYKYWRYDPDVSPLQAWSGYNGGPYWYHHWTNGPNRANYEQGLERAKSILPERGKTVLSYDSHVEPFRQRNDFACSIRTTQWALASVGVMVDIGDLQDYMVPRYVSTDLGLLSADGSGLAEVWRHYLPAGADVSLTGILDWAGVKSRADKGPLALGSPNPQMYHWFPVCAITGPDRVRIANPAPNWPRQEPLGDELNEDQFRRYGPWYGVFLDVGGGRVVDPYTVGSGLRDMMTADDSEPAMSSTFFPLGVQPADVEMCLGMNGTVYWWHIPTGRSWRTRP